MKTHCISFAYSSSPYANQINGGKQCYVVEICGELINNPFHSLDEAIKYAATQRTTPDRWSFDNSRTGSTL